LAKSATELLICSDPDLARQDREFAALYTQAKGLAPSATFVQIGGVLAVLLASLGAKRPFFIVWGVTESNRRPAD
jgi:hypothetical protein